VSYARWACAGLLWLACAACAPASPAAPTAAPKPTAAPPAASAPTAPATSAAAQAAPGQPVQTMAGVQPLAQRASLKLAINPTLIGYLPLLIALDKGYFAQANLDVQPQLFNASAATQLPLLARGDLDVAPVVSTPATYNQFAQGFNIQLIAAFGTPKAGRASDAWLTVRADEVDQIKTPQDLKGKVIEGGTDGTPFAVLAYGAIQQAHLTVGQDVTLQFRARGTADMLAMAQSHAADVIAMTEPTASNAEQQGIAKRWLSYSELAPWYQSSLLGASSQFLNGHPDVAEKLLEVYAVTARELNATDGVWTDDLIEIVSKRAGVDAATVKAQGGVPYYDPNVPVSIESLDRTQQLWVQNGQVKEPVEVAKLVNNEPLERALQVIGRMSS
jgi:NitT/TauT family transport system substrate-binding protein